MWRAFASGLLLRYFVVAVLKVAVDFAAFNAALLGIREPHWQQLVFANSSGFLVAAWIAYRLNSRFVFGVPRRRGDFRRFLAVSVVGGLLYNAALLALVAVSGAEGSAGLNLAKLAALGASAGWNFVGSALFVFRRVDPSEASEAGREDRDAA